MVVAAVVLPPQHRLVGELVRRDEVLEAQVGRVHPELEGHDIGQPLDGVDGLGHAERAAVGDAARRLVRVHAVDLGEGVLQVVGPGDDGEQPGRELRRVGGGVGVAVVGDRLDLEGGEGAVLRRPELGLQVVVARERVGLQVLHPVLDPLDGLPHHDRRGNREHVPRVDRHLAAEPAADVRGDDLDLLLRQPDVPGHQRQDGADGVRGLGGHVDLELAHDPIEIGDAAAGLDGRDVDARNVDVLLDDDVGAGERALRRGPVPHLPVEDVVVLLVLLVGAQHRRVGLERLERIDDDRQRLVVHLHRLDPVGRRVAVGGDHRRHLLRLVHDLLGRQHHLGVGHQGRHPVQVVLLEGLAGDDREHAGDLQRVLGIDGLDPRVRERAADDVQIEHARKLDVVHVVALAADEARVLLALHRVTHAAHFRRRLGCHGFSPPRRYYADSCRSFAAACSIDLTMFT